jgi:hypothetical protein
VCVSDTFVSSEVLEGCGAVFWRKKEAFKFDPSMRS